MKIIFKQKDFIAFCVKTTLIASIPAVALAFAAHFILSSIFPGAEWLYPKHTETNVYIDILGAVILGPIIETYILIKLLSFIRIYESRNFRVCILAGIIFGVFHGLFGVVWFFGPCWLFMVFSYNYLIWEVRDFKLAFWAACIPHMLHNGFALSINAITN